MIIIQKKEKSTEHLLFEDINDFSYEKIKYDMEKNIFINKESKKTNSSYSILHNPKIQNSPYSQQDDQLYENTENNNFYYNNTTTNEEPIPKFDDNFEMIYPGNLNVYQNQNYLW